MNHHKLLQQMISLTLVVLSLVGCGAPIATPTPVVIVVTATPQPTPTPVVIVVTATPQPTPMSSAPTPTPVPPAVAPTQPPVPFTPVPLPPMPTVQVSNEYPVVQLTTRLGVETTVEVTTTDTDNDVLNHVLRSLHQRGRQFLLRIADGIYMVVPFRMFRQAEEREGVHVVTLADGQELKGQLDFVLNGPDGRTYDWRTVSKAVLISLPEDEYGIEPSEQKPAAPWQLHIVKPVDLTYSVSNPRFVFQYYSSAGYLIGGSDRETESQSFYLKVGDEEILGHLLDFEEITFSELVEGETDVQIKVKAQSGIETAGPFVLKAEDSRGYHEAHTWFLVMDLADSELTMVLKNPRCTLRKVSE